MNNFQYLKDGDPLIGKRCLLIDDEVIEDSVIGTIKGVLRSEEGETLDFMADENGGMGVLAPISAQRVLARCEKWSQNLLHF